MVNDEWQRTALLRSAHVRDERANFVRRAAILQDAILVQTG